MCRAIIIIIIISHYAITFGGSDVRANKNGNYNINNTSYTLTIM